MGRKFRVEYYGAIYHIIQRGINKQAIFVEDEDKEILLKILSETKEIYDFKIYAYVIMDNHYHFLIQTFNIPISRIMHRINTRYAKYYNYDRNRTGPVFENRYKGILVQNESYLLTLIRYIHNNPVLARICTTMESYRWSSDVFYRINMESIVDIDRLLDMFSADRTAAITTYMDLMDSSIGGNLPSEDIYGEKHVIGTDEFRKTIVDAGENEYIDLDQILSIVCPKGKDFKSIKKGSRKRYLTGYKRRYVELARKLGYTYEEIGRNIGITRDSARVLLKD